MLYASLDFTPIPSYPNPLSSGHLWHEHLLKFQGHGVPSAQHLRDFNEFANHFNINHDDVLMKVFLMTLEGDARIW